MCNGIEMEQSDMSVQTRYFENLQRRRFEPNKSKNANQRITKKFRS